MMQVGSIYGNLDVNDVLNVRETIIMTVFDKNRGCQEKIKESIMRLYC